MKLTWNQRRPRVKACAVGVMGGGGGGWGGSGCGLPGSNGREGRSFCCILVSYISAVTCGLCNEGLARRRWLPATTWAYTTVGRLLVVLVLFASSGRQLRDGMLVLGLKRLSREREGRGWKGRRMGVGCSLCVFVMKAKGKCNVPGSSEET